MHISDILKEPCEKLYSRTYHESYKNPCVVALPLAHIFFHFENSGAVAGPLTHIFFHFQTLVWWPYHSRTYSSIFKTLVQWPYYSRTYSTISKTLVWRPYHSRTNLLILKSSAVTVPLTHVSQKHQAHMKTTEYKTTTND